MGTPGHMAHPFDVEEVKNGEDLLDYINTAALRLHAGEIEGSVKWDGINTSFKLVTTEDGKKEFRMDRGTSDISSVRGLNAEMAMEKWGATHGMPHAIKILLDIFNTSLPEIEPELKILGLWDDPTKYFNDFNRIHYRHVNSSIVSWWNHPGYSYSNTRHGNCIHTCNFWRG